MDDQQVIEIVRDVLGESAVSVTRQPFGHRSVTYDVELPTRHVIVRTNEEPETFASTQHNLACLSRLGLPVSRVIAADLTKRHWPAAFLVLEKIPGRDLRYELETMTDPQMTRVAEQIVGFQRAVATLPPGTGYGYTALGATGPFQSWRQAIDHELPLVRNGKWANSGEFAARAARQVERFADYLAQVPPTCFLDDITVKNVIVQNGQLRGLIDFDCVCYGDPLLMIGLTATGVVADIGQHRLFYVEELCRLWKLTPIQRQIVDLYSVCFALGFLAKQHDHTEPWAVRTRGALQEWLARLKES